MSRRASRGFDPTRFADLRKEHGFTRADLARLAGLSTPTIDRWESGSRRPQVGPLKAVAAVLGVAIGDIIKIDREDRYPADWRILAGLTQPELGRAAGIETNQISRIERGEIALTDDAAERITPHLGIGVEEFRQSYLRAKNRPAGSRA